MKNPVLNFFLLILKIFFNLTSDVIYKNRRLLKTFLEKNFKFVLYEGGNSVLFNLSLVLLPVKIEFFWRNKVGKDMHL